jgi:hypothetical protein
MIKEHCSNLMQMTITKELIGRPENLPPVPHTQDRFSDVSEDKRGQLAQAPYYETTASPLNPTVLPDRFLKTFAPVITIRHPAKQIGSLYKVAVAAGGWSTKDLQFEMLATYKFSRLVFDYFCGLYLSEQPQASEAGPIAWPIVIDGDDLINDAERITQRFCQLTGLDANGVIYKWEKVELNDAFDAVWFGTLEKSTGILKNEVRFPS